MADRLNCLVSILASKISLLNLEVITYLLMAVAAQSKEWDYGRSLAGTAGSIPARGHECLSLVCVLCMLSGRCLCDGPITRPESYRVWCV